MFRPNSLYYADGYKTSHKAMLAPGTTTLYGTWIPRNLNHAPKGITKIVSFGQQLTWQWLHDEFEENFFYRDQRRTIPLNFLREKAMRFAKDMSLYLGMDYDGEHFGQLWDLGYLPIRAKALPEGIETSPNIPHMTFVNTVPGFAWLTLYLETVVSALAWKASTAATIALQYQRNLTKAVEETDKENMWFVDFGCHDFSARGLDPFSMVAVGLGHATSHKGSDSLITIPASRYFYGESEDSMPIFSVNASEHSVSTTKIFTVGEQQMIADWLKIFPKGILSIVSDTFDLWKLITEYLPANKEAIMARDGKLVIRPDSGNPVDIICGFTLESVKTYEDENMKAKLVSLKSIPEQKGVIELLWDIFGGTTNEQGFKVLDPHIGAIYGDSITLDRQVEIYARLKAKGFAATNIVLGVGSFTYQYNTRDTLGFAAKGAWFEVEENCPSCTDVKKEEHFHCETCMDEGTVPKGYGIYKDPVTDGGGKKSLKGLLQVTKDETGTIVCLTEQTEEQEKEGMLQTIYENGKFFNKTTLTKVRESLRELR